MQVEFSHDIKEKIRELGIDPADIVFDVSPEGVRVDTQTSIQQALDEQNNFIQALETKIDASDSALDLAIAVIFLLDVLDTNKIKSSPKNFKAANDHAWRSPLFRSIEVKDRAQRKSSIRITVNGKLLEVTGIFQSKKKLYRLHLKRLIQLGIDQKVPKNEIEQCFEGL